MNKHSATVENLISRARQGSGSGLGQLLDFFRPALTEVAARQVGTELQSRMSQSDLVQDTMLTASRKFPEFGGQTEPEFRSWMIEILQSRLVDGLRRHRVAAKRRQQSEVRISGSQLVGRNTSASELAVLEEDAARLLQAIETLPAEQRDILRHRYFEDMTFETIAELRGVSVATVWRRWSEAIVVLKRTIQ